MIQLLIIIQAIIAIIIYMISVKDGKQVCNDNYILISYLYALFYICFTAYLSIMIFINYPILFGKIETLYMFVGILVLYIALFFALMFIPPRFIIVKHIVSLLFLITGSIILAILFFTYAPDAIFIAFFLTVILFLIMTLIAWKFKEYISSKVTLLLVVVFLGMIIIEGIVLWFFPNSIINTIVILVVLMIICYLLLVKTKRMIENAKNCKEPDYVQEGIGLLLSFQNILLQILQLRR